jgi:hypothetical protein
VADKDVTVPVPEERIPEFYLWFSAFLASEPGTGPPRHRPGRGGFGPRGPHHGDDDRPAWTAEDRDAAAWLYGRLTGQARELFDLLIEHPGERFSANDLATRLRLEKGAHGIAGLLAWPGRWSRRLERAFPVVTEGRADGGTDYAMTPEVAALFADARA